MVNCNKHVQCTSVNTLRGLIMVNMLSMVHLCHRKACTDLYNFLRIRTNPYGSVGVSDSVIEIVYHGYKVLTVA